MSLVFLIVCLCGYVSVCVCVCVQRDCGMTEICRV